MKQIKRTFECCSCGCDLKLYDWYFKFDNDLYCEKCVEADRRLTDSLPDEYEMEEWDGI